MARLASRTQSEDALQGRAVSPLGRGRHLRVVQGGPDLERAAPLPPELKGIALAIPLGLAGWAVILLPVIVIARLVGG
ncbi:MAG: hypothetical protein ICV59_04260 [Thermoleophilia bacterium]|nr:hypothetical protein [Thermoleophilia bacterium]